MKEELDKAIIDEKKAQTELMKAQTKRTLAEARCINAQAAEIEKANG